MAIVQLDPNLIALHGRIGDVVYKTYRDKIVATRVPRFDGYVPTSAQRARRTRMAEATAYAKRIYADPVAKAVYIAAAQKLGRNAFRLAVSDYLRVKGSASRGSAAAEPANRVAQPIRDRLAISDYLDGRSRVADRSELETRCPRQVARAKPPLAPHFRVGTRRPRRVRSLERWAAHSVRGFVSAAVTQHDPAMRGAPGPPSRSPNHHRDLNRKGTERTKDRSSVRLSVSFVTFCKIDRTSASSD